MTDLASDTVGAVILAGGLARRMGGGDKPLREVGGRTLLSHVLTRLEGQVKSIVLNANSAPDLFKEYGLPVTADSIDGFAGPLAGVLAGMDWYASHHPEIRYMVSVPGDGPFIPLDLVEQLYKPILNKDAIMSVAVSGGRQQPVVGIWDISLKEDLRNAIVEEEIFKVDRWTARYEMAEVEFETAPFDPFFNANRVDDLAEAEDIYSRYIAISG